MTKKRLLLIFLAVLTAFVLAACGDSDGSEITSSTPEGLQTFGVPVDPSAQPSTGQVLPGMTDPQTSAVPGDIGQVGEQNVETSGAVPSAAPSSTTTTNPTIKPSTKPSSQTSAPATSPSPSHNIEPPAPASTATADEVTSYIGKSLTELVSDLGYPIRSDYEYIDDEDPSQGEIGTLFFQGFTVTTRRDDDGEIITAVIVDPVETSPEASPENT